MLQEYQTWQKIFMWLGPIFVIMGALCGIGWNHYGLKIKELEKLEKQSKPEEIKTTEKVSKTFNIQGDYVHGSKYVDKSSIVAPNALIVTNNQSGGQNTINYYHNEFRSPNDEISNTIFVNIENLINNYPNHPLTNIEIESGNLQRHKVASQLEQYLSENNLGRYPVGNTFSGRFPEYPISIFFNSNNRRFVEDLLKALKPYIVGEFHLVELPDFPSEFVRFYINGQPQFDISGKVKIE